MVLLQTSRGCFSAGRAWLQPKQLRNVYIAALIVIQVAGVVGSLYLKVAMNSSQPPHPVTFALYRELLAGADHPTFWPSCTLAYSHQCILWQLKFDQTTNASTILSF